MAFLSNGIVIILPKALLNSPIFLLLKSQTIGLGGWLAGRLHERCYGSVHNRESAVRSVATTHKYCHILNHDIKSDSLILGLSVTIFENVFIFCLLLADLFTHAGSADIVY